VTWEPLTLEAEAANTRRFWEWLMNLRRLCHGAGLTFAAYCYSSSAENTYLRRLAIADEALAAEIERFIMSDEWIDLLKEWDSQLITGGSSSLKRIAPLVGFQWRVVDASGGESMIKHDLAADGDEDAREWLLTYNQGDVEATLAVREWMAAAHVPRIDKADLASM